jgi:hypothetical protein
MVIRPLKVHFARRGSSDRSDQRRTTKDLGSSKRTGRDGTTGLHSAGTRRRWVFQHLRYRVTLFAHCSPLVTAVCLIADSGIATGVIAAGFVTDRVIACVTARVIAG